MSNANIDYCSQTEIQLLKKLKHPNIVKYIDTIRTESALHIVIEYVENGSLANLVKKFGGGFPETLVAIYISQVLKGLDFLHAQGVIHRYRPQYCCGFVMHP